MVQVFLPAASLQDLVKVGKALSPLRQEGVLIVGSGGSVHNLHALNRDHRTEDWAIDFEAWLREAVEKNHFEWLITAEQFPHNFQRAHPTLEHYAPLIVAWAAGGPDQPGTLRHPSKASFSFLAIFCKRWSRVQIKAVSANVVDARRWV
ncbi:MAG: class III extradiol ring-cleavage dioxygenase, partial [Gammaproteobacteria bacterium]